MALLLFGVLMQSLRPGKTTPSGVQAMLAIYGDNPHGEPNYRLIWSERKMAYFAGEMCPQYEYLPHACWVLEKWLDPRTDAGPEYLWNHALEYALGPYPKKGTYNYIKHFPSDWYPNDQNVRLLAKGIEESRDFTPKERMDAIRENLEHKRREEILQTAAAIEELQDSGSRGVIQQAVSGPKNNFRNTDDFERDHAKDPDVLPGVAKGGLTIIPNKE